MGPRVAKGDSLLLLLHLRRALAPHSPFCPGPIPGRAAVEGVAADSNAGALPHAGDRGLVHRLPTKMCRQAAFPTSPKKAGVSQKLVRQGHA